MEITIVNGPNLNLLGKREPEIYGTKGFEHFLTELKNEFPEVRLNYFQSNIEGELIDIIQNSGFAVDGIIFNPGGYTHTSVALGDAVAAIPAPVIEVHISNVQAREEFRKISHLSAHCRGTIAGLGLDGYRLAIQWFKQNQKPLR